MGKPPLGKPPLKPTEPPKLWALLPGGSPVLVSEYRGRAVPTHYAHEGDDRWTPAAEWRTRQMGGAA